jgi:hypothetical protein
MNPTHEDGELDRALVDLWREADAGTRAPDGFDTRLFARLEREAPRVQARAGDATILAWSRPALPWWVRAAGERHVALALLIAGAVVAWPTWWSTQASTAGALGTGIAQVFAQLLTQLLGRVATPALFAPLLEPRVALVTAACFAPAIAWVSYQAALAAEHWVHRTARARAVPARHA